MRKFRVLILLAIGALALSSCAGAKIKKPTPVQVPGIVFQMEREANVASAEADPFWIQFGGGQYRFFARTFGGNEIQFNPAMSTTMPAMAMTVFLEISFNRSVQNFEIQPELIVDGGREVFPPKKEKQVAKFLIPFRPAPSGVMEVSACLSYSGAGQTCTQKMNFTGRQKPVRK